MLFSDNTARPNNTVTTSDEICFTFGAFCLRQSMRHFGRLLSDKNKKVSWQGVLLDIVGYVFLYNTEIMQGKKKRVVRHCQF